MILCSSSSLKWLHYVFPIFAFMVHSKSNILCNPSGMDSPALFNMFFPQSVPYHYTMISKVAWRCISILESAMLYFVLKPETDQEISTKYGLWKLNVWFGNIPDYKVLVYENMIIWSHPGKPLYGPYHLFPWKMQKLHFMEFAILSVRANAVMCTTDMRLVLQKSTYKHI